MNLKKIIKEIQDKAMSHAQVKMFKNYAEEKISNDVAADYPLIIAYPSTFSITENALENYIDIFCLDRQLQNQSNMMTVFNDTQGILVDILAMLQKDALIETSYEVVGNATQIIDESIDFVGGWLIQLKATTDYQANICDIPS